MSELPRTPGKPEPEAAAIIELIRNYARRAPDKDPARNAARVLGMGHIYDAATDERGVALAIVNVPDREHPGRLTMRAEANLLGWSSLDTINKHIGRGRALLEEEAS